MLPKIHFKAFRFSNQLDFLDNANRIFLRPLNDPTRFDSRGYFDEEPNLIRPQQEPINAEICDVVGHNPLRR